MDPRKHTPRHIIIALPNITDKERILQTAREKERGTYRGVPNYFLKTNLTGKKGLERSIQGSSGQDGGVGRYPLLPHTTKRRITTNLKSINN